MTSPPPAPYDPADPTTATAAAEAPTGALGGRQMAASAVAYWMATGVTLVGSLLRGKVAAVFLGTSGLGVSAQLSTFSALIAALAALGLGTGGVKLIAEARVRSDDTALRNLVSFLMWAPTALGLVFFAGVCVFARPLSTLLLDTDRYAGLLVVATIAVPISLALGSFQVVMQGFERARRLAVLSVLSALLTTLMAVPLTVRFGLDGAVAAIPITAAATLLTFCIREPWVLRLALPVRRLAGRHRSQLAVLAGASLAASVLSLTCDSAVRAATVHRLGIAENGLYQPAQMLTNLVLAQMAGAIGLVLLPRLSHELGGDRIKEVLVTLERAARACVVFIVAAVLVAMALRDVFIVIFFDSTFLGVSDVLAIQLTAELPRFLAYALGAALLPAGLVREWLVGGVLSNVARVAISLALLPTLGLRALAISVVVQWTVVAVWTVWVLRRRMEWRPQARLGRLVAAGAAVLAGALALALGVGAVVAGVAAALGAVLWVLLVGRAETRQLVASVLPRVTGQGA